MKEAGATCESGETAGQDRRLLTMWTASSCCRETRESSKWREYDPKSRRRAIFQLAIPVFGAARWDNAQLNRGGSKAGRHRYFGAAGHAGLKTHHAEFSCNVTWVLGCFQGRRSCGPCKVPSGRKARVRLPRSSMTS